MVDAQGEEKFSSDIVLRFAGVWVTLGAMARSGWWLELMWMVGTSSSPF